MSRNLFFNQKISFSENNLESIIKACLERNQNAQSLLYKQFFGYSKSVCLRYSSNQEEAKEILNEGFLKVFNNLDKYLPELSFKAWLRTIMVNTAISFYRKNQKFQQEIGYDDYNDPSYNDEILENIAADDILRHVQELKPIYRTVFTMYAVDGYSHREISEHLSINEVTIRSYYSRAKAKLQEILANNYPELIVKNSSSSKI